MWKGLIATSVHGQSICSFHGLDEPCALFCSLDDDDGDADAHDIGKMMASIMLPMTLLLLMTIALILMMVMTLIILTMLVMALVLLLTLHLFRQSRRDLYNESCVLVTWFVFASLQIVCVSSRVCVSWC